MAADGDAGRSLRDADGWSGRALPDPGPTQPQLPMPTTPVISASPGSPGPDLERASYGPTRAIRAKRNGPYDRPTAGRHAAAGPQAAAVVRTDSARALTRSRRPWLGSGLSKIISTGATYLYASVFGRRLQPPPQITNVDAQEVDASEQVLSPSVGADDIQARNDSQPGRVENVREPDVATSSFSEVEDLLKRRTLSRDEFQRLSLLLLSRVTGNGVDANQQPTHVESDVISARLEGRPLGGSQSEAQRWRQDLRKSREERDNAVRTLTLYDNGRPSTTIGGASEKTDALGSSPVEVARAFMGGRPSPHIGSSPREPSNALDVNRVSSGPDRSPHAPQTAIIKRAATEVWNENQFRTPPPPSASPWNRGRMLSRTPYSRPLRQHPPREKVVDGTFGTPVTTRWTPIRTPVTGGREMLKRRSAVLDEGWSSGGPIRRTRQKAIIPVTPSSFGQPRRSEFPVTPVIGSSVATPVSSVAGKLSPRTVDGSPRKEKELLTQSGHFYVPAQSSETARRILETLDRMTPSPKGKALEEELARVRDKPPSTLTEGMLNDQARKSMRFAEFSLPSLPNESREPGPSGSTVEVSPAFGSAESTFKLSESVSKVKGKGKAVPPSENGPGALCESNHERLSMAEGGSVKLTPVRHKDADAVIIPESRRGTGFRMNAVFEESGSEDEGRATQANPSGPPPITTSKLPILTSKSITAMPSVFGAGPLSPPSTPVGGLSSFPRSSTAADASKTVSSGFTFPTRAPLECPPTPKAMSPMSNSPKATLAAPFPQFGPRTESAAPSGPAVELHKSAGENANSKPESKSEFSFGSAPASVASVAQTAPEFPVPLNSGVPNAFKQSSPFGGAPFAVAAPSFSSAPNPISATNSSPAFSLKAGDPVLPPASTSPFKTGAVFPNASQFPSSASASLFGSGSSSAQSASGVAPPSMSISPSSISGSGSAAVPNFLAVTGGGTESLSVPAGSPGFGQVAAFSGFKSSSTTAGPLVSPEFQESGGKGSGNTDLLDAERPQKRTTSILQQREPSKPQELVATMPSHSFTAFGTNIGSFAPTKAETVTFAPTGATTTTSASLFPLSSFGQASTSAQQTSALPPAGPIPFTFGAPASSAGNVSTSSAPTAGFGNNPPFPSFTGSLFGSTTSGSTFGDSQASPMTFASTSAPSAFGSASANSVFGRFSSETGSQSPSVPVFGSGFSAPARSTTPSFPTFGAPSSPSFAFGNATNSSSGAAFGFGFGKSATSSQPSTVFGLSGSAAPLAFGASPTTNGTMASDVVNDQSNMDDNSMAEEPSSQMGGSLSPEPSIFGVQASSGTGPYVFGSQTGGPGAAPPSIFGGFQAPSNTGLATAAAANPFAAPQPAGSLDFAGGSFTLGSGGDRPATRKFIKAKRTSAKRGK